MEIVMEFLQRAIDAEAQVTALENHTEWLIRTSQEMQSSHATLTEENDIQRQAIQNLSAQVVAYRDCLEQIGKGICESNIYGIKMYVNELLASPDPGAEIRERLEKLKKVAEAAESICESSLFVILGMDKFRQGQELAKALATLEGGRE